MLNPNTEIMRDVCTYFQQDLNNINGGLLSEA
jgi:hypothetical protein